MAALLSAAAPLTAAGQTIAPDSSVDGWVEGLMQRYNLPGATVAVALDRSLVYAAGYNLDASARLRIGSVSKVFTALTIEALAQQGRLDLDDPVLSVMAPVGAEPLDERWRGITIRHLLSHRGGFDPAATGFDPVFPDYHSLEQLGLPLPPSPDDVIRLMMRLPLAFAPGTREAYSNFGYLLLGRVIESVTKTSYAVCVKQTLLADQGITRMELGGALEVDRLAGEPFYQDEAGAPLTPSFYPPYGQPVPRPYGGTHGSLIESAGGWIAAAPDLVRFASRMPEPLLSASLKRPSWAPAGAPFWTGPAWTVIPVNGAAALLHHGGLPGARSILLRMPLENGVTGTVAILFAGSPPESREEEASEAILTAAVEILKVLQSRPGPDRSPLFFADGPGPFLEPYGVLHPATGWENEFAAGQLVDILGSNFDESVRVKVNGVSVELISVTPGRIQAVLPSELSPGQLAELLVITDHGASRLIYVPIVESAPGLLAVVLNGDGSLNSAKNPVSPGDWLWCFGIGFPRDPIALSVAGVTVAVDRRMVVGTGIELLVIRTPAVMAGPELVPVPVRPAGRIGRGPAVYLRESPGMRSFGRP